MNKSHDVTISEPGWSDPAEYFSFEVDGEPRKIKTIARDSTGDMSLIRITAEQARKVVDALEAAIADLETPHVGDMIDSEKTLEKLPNGSILRSPVTGTAYWRDRSAWHNPVSVRNMDAGIALAAAGGPLELLHIGGSK